MGILCSLKICNFAYLFGGVVEVYKSAKVILCVHFIYNALNMRTIIVMGLLLLGTLVASISCFKVQLSAFKGAVRLNLEGVYPFAMFARVTPFDCFQLYYNKQYQRKRCQ
jgi:hypothetical protein